MILQKSSLTKDLNIINRFNLDSRFRGNDKVWGNFFDRSNTKNALVLLRIGSRFVIPAKAGIQIKLLIAIKDLKL